MVAVLVSGVWCVCVCVCVFGGGGWAIIKQIKQIHMPETTKKQKVLDKQISGGAL